MKENRKEKITGGDYLSLGLYAFAGLGMEVLYAYLLEPVLYGAPMQDWSDVQIILHWILTCITWGAFAFILIQKSDKKYCFPLSALRLFLPSGSMNVDAKLTFTLETSV